jgi:c-di-GMP-binding flagellar brake protein YcgR
MATQEESQSLLREAIARNAAVVLSLPSAGMLRHHKTRFLGQEGEAFWVESIPAERPLVDELVNEKKPVGISFKSGTNTVALASSIQRREPAFRVNDSTTVEAVLLPFPDKVKAIQRRHNYRVRVREDTGVAVRVWRIAEHAYIGDRPLAAQQIETQVRDLSLGGLGVTLVGKGAEPPKVLADERLRIELVYKDISMLLEGRLKYPIRPAEGNTVKGGIQFKALDNSLEGRQKSAQLTKIVGELQREEVRRARLGI